MSSNLMNIKILKKETKFESERRDREKKRDRKREGGAQLRDVGLNLSYKTRWDADPTQAARLLRPELNQKIEKSMLQYF